jgi:hypothetical protein
MNTETGSPAIYWTSFRCVLVGISSDQEHEAPALGHAIALASVSHATLSLYVFAPQLHEPFPMSAASASGWLAEKANDLRN